MHAQKKIIHTRGRSACAKRKLKKRGTHEKKKKAGGKKRAKTKSSRRGKMVIRAKNEALDSRSLWRGTWKRKKGSNKKESKELGNQGIKTAKGRKQEAPSQLREKQESHCWKNVQEGNARRKGGTHTGNGLICIERRFPEGKRKGGGEGSVKKGSAQSSGQEQEKPFARRQTDAQEKSKEKGGVEGCENMEAHKKSQKRKKIHGGGGG